MSRKEPSFAERIATAANAKRTQLEKIRAAALSHGAQSTEQRTTRIEVAEARSVRIAKHKDAKRVAADLKSAQRAALKVRKAQAVLEEQTRKDAARVSQGHADAALKLDQKAARDSKYAARKARQK